MPMFNFALEDDATVANLKDLFKQKYEPAAEIHNDKLAVVTLRNGIIRNIFQDTEKCMMIDSERNDVLIVELAG